MVTIANPPPQLRGRQATDDCAVERALAVVGAKWTLVVLHNLMAGPKRFSELQRDIPAASPKMLTVRLRDLEQLGLLTRTIHAEVPPRVEYELTVQGQSLRPILGSIEKWGRSLRPARPSDVGGHRAARR
jgi:DNA-binding HxlR family transcriptional regulator